ncbi:MAG: ComEC/Rec2 family competence protein [Candidatus Shapirobacteria bacterium]
MKRQEIWQLIVVVLSGILIYRFIDKERMLLVINQSLPSKEAGILAGIILGDVSGLSKEVYGNFRNSGIVHLLVVSGTNVMFLMRGIVENLSVFLGRKKAILLGIIALLKYGQITGWQIPIIRATVLVMIFYLAQLLGRKYDLWRGIGAAVVIMLLVDFQMIKEASFWMSLVAFLGVVTSKKWTGKKVVDNLLLAGWVSLWLTPVIGIAFSTINILGPVANALVVFSMEPILLIGGLGIIVGRWLLIILYPLLWYLDWVAKGVGSLGWASVSFKFNWWMVVGWYLVLGWWLRRRNEN